jgi:hypothetical protein
VIKVYRGNDWKPDEIVSDLRDAVQTKNYPRIHAD